MFTTCPIIFPTTSSSSSSSFTLSAALQKRNRRANDVWLRTCKEFRRQRGALLLSLPVFCSDVDLCASFHSRLLKRVECEKIMNRVVSVVDDGKKKMKCCSARQAGRQDDRRDGLRNEGKKYKDFRNN